MNITHVTVCVNYLDYMAVAHEHNRAAFDDFIVVTSHADVATQQFCVEKGIGLRVTDAFYRGGAVFNKGTAINEGLQLAYARRHPEPLDWVCLMDADTFVPFDFRAQLAALQPSLDPEYLYGARRVMLPTRADYEDWVSGRRAEGSFRSPHGHCFGWLQLFHWGNTALKRLPWGEWYPQTPDCRDCDWMFMRALGGDLADEYTRSVGSVRQLPFSVYNLGPDGVNHQSRVSPPFTQAAP